MTDFNESSGSGGAGGGVTVVRYPDDERAALAARVRGEEPLPSPEEALAAAEQVAIDTLALIRDTLAVLRQERDDVNASIRELVDAESLWQPIVSRIERHRNGDGDEGDAVGSRDQPTPTRRTQ